LAQAAQSGGVLRQLIAGLFSFHSHLIVFD
jgi:hypothetical protein